MTRWVSHHVVRVALPLSVLVCVVAPDGIAQVVPADSGIARTATVTYVTGRSVYLDAGSRDGLTEGARVEILRGGAAVAVLRVTFLSPGRASCEIVSSTVEIAVGDRARFVGPVPSALGDSTAATARSRTDSAGTSRPGRAPRWRSGVVHGRVGLRYLAIAQRDSGSERMGQPSAELRLHGSSLAGTPLSIDIDARARRTAVRHLDGATTYDTDPHVYRLAFSWNADRPGVRVSLGRQYAESFTNISLFDGISAALHGERWSAGSFAGTQPDDENLGWSSEIRELGVFVLRGSPPASRARWSVGAGAVGSYAAEGIDRELMFVHGTFAGDRLVGSLTGEADVNRGWKREAGEPAITPTSVVASVRLRVTPALDLHAGADTRRRVRLWRDRETPETLLDDAMRRGAWGGISAVPIRGWRLSLDGRAAVGGAAGGAQSVTASVGADRIGPLDVSARLRSTRHTSDVSAGWLHSAAIGGAPLHGVHVEMEAGLRSQESRGGAASADVSGTTTVHWLGATADLAMARSWFVLLSLTRERGGWDSYDQLHATVSWRF